MVSLSSVGCLTVLTDSEPRCIATRNWSNVIRTWTNEKNGRRTVGCWYYDRVVGHCVY